MSDQAKFAALFARLAEEGQIFNNEKFRNEGNGIYCFKISGRRMPCFMAGSDVYITHGFIKGPDRVQREEMRRAERIRASHQKGGSR